ncbi:MAG TPA: hypothetical protein DDW34_11885 [Clostridium sp.]|nr:hypothetical protein [Clostridium sp.]
METTSLLTYIPIISITGQKVLFLFKEYTEKQIHFLRIIKRLQQHRLIKMQKPVLQGNFRRFSNCNRAFY